jgi:hypothetical protein
MAAGESQRRAEGPLNEGLLRIYLRDHHAAALGGTELARRTLANNKRTPFKPALEKLAADIEEDRLTLERIMERLGVSPDPVKEAAVWVLEKVSRLKPNGRVLQYSPLSRVLETETLRSGIDAKKAMWNALRHIAEVDARLDATELGKLERRADDQRRRVEAIRLEAARLAFTSS